MKLHKNIRIESIASSDRSRCAIGEPYLDITDGKGTLVSTNGNAMAIVPVALAPEDVAGYVSADALRAARKQSKRTDEASLALGGSVATLADGSTMPRAGVATGCTFPSWRQVVPRETPAVTVALNAKLLWELAQAMGTQGVKLCIASPDQPVVVLPAAAGCRGEIHCACDETRGVIMPIRVS